jgi:hypothetical protein
MKEDCSQNRQPAPQWYYFEIIKLSEIAKKSIKIFSSCKI